MAEYIVYFQKNGTLDRVVGPRLRREVRVEALDEMAAEAIAGRQVDHTFRIVRVVEA